MLDGRLKLCFTLAVNAIERAIDAVGGKQVELATRISVTPQAVNQWVSGLRPVPAKHCIAIETATGGQVTRHDLRPDVFGPPPSNEPHSVAA
jgi:DNA-binding transcriptional regulator YdaS (Cro superfamily)